MKNLLPFGIFALFMVCVFLEYYNFNKAGLFVVFVYSFVGSMVLYNGILDTFKKREKCPKIEPKKPGKVRVNLICCETGEKLPGVVINMSFERSKEIFPMIAVGKSNRPKRTKVVVRDISQTTKGGKQMTFYTCFTLDQSKRNYLKMQEICKNNLF